MLMGLVYDERGHSYSQQSGVWPHYFEVDGVLGAYDADTLDFLPEQVLRERKAAKSRVVFPDKSESFCNGFEAGQLWEQMLCKPSTIGGAYRMPYHSANLELFKNMAQCNGYDMEILKDFGEWAYVLFTKWPTTFKVVK